MDSLMHERENRLHDSRTRRTVASQASQALGEHSTSAPRLFAGIPAWMEQQGSCGTVNDCSAFAGLGSGATVGCSDGVAPAGCLRWSTQGGKGARKLDVGSATWVGPTPLPAGRWSRRPRPAADAGRPGVDLGDPWYMVG